MVREKIRNGIRTISLAALLAYTNVAFSAQSPQHSSQQGSYSRIPDRVYRQVTGRSNFNTAITRLRKYNLEETFEKYYEKFGSAKYGLELEDMIAFGIVESSLNPSARTSRGDCKGIGQVTSAAVKTVNRRYGTRFVCTSNPERFEDQVGSAVGYFTLKAENLHRKYGLEGVDLVNVTYFAYNAGSAPVDYILGRLKKKGQPITWKNIESHITVTNLRASSSFYRKWSSSKLKQKVSIIKNYVKSANAYSSYLERAREIHNKA
ncbi:MAG: hypothetical protein AABX59_03390 [Nanoarchaeota archaeon]